MADEFFDENETESGEDLWAPNVEYRSIPKDGEKGEKKARKKKEPRRGRSEAELQKDAYETPEYADRKQPKSVTIIPTPKAEAVIITTLPGPQNLSVVHDDEAQIPKIRFGNDEQPPNMSPPVPPRSPPPPSDAGGFFGGDEPFERKKTPKPPKASKKVKLAFSGLGMGFKSQKEQDEIITRVVSKFSKLSGKSQGVADQLFAKYSLIKQNETVLKTLSATSKEAQQALDVMNDERLQTLITTLQEGKKISEDQAQYLGDKWEELSSNIEKSGVSLETSLAQQIENVERIVGDTAVDVTERRDSLLNIVELLSDQESNRFDSIEEREQEIASLREQVEDERLAFIEQRDEELAIKKQELEKAKIEGTATEQLQNDIEQLLLMKLESPLSKQLKRLEETGRSFEVLQELKALNIAQSNISQEQASQIINSLEEIKPSFEQTKIYGTVDEITHQLDRIILDNGNLNSLLEEQQSSTKNFLKKFKDKGEELTDTEAKKGIVDGVSSALGIGGLGDVLGTLADIGIAGMSFASFGGRALRGVGSVARAIPFGSMASGIGAIGGKALGLGSKALGGIGKAAKLAGPATGKLAGMGGGAAKLAGKGALPLAVAFGAYDAFAGFADSQSVVGKKDASLLNKSGAAIASLVSGLSLGVFDKKDIYKGFSLVGDGIEGMFSDVSDIFQDKRLGVVDKVWNSAKYLGSTASTLFSDVGDYLNDEIKNVAESGFFEDLYDFVMGNDAKQRTFALNTMALPKSLPSVTGGEQDLMERIKKEESFSAKKYPDIKGYSIGYGHQIQPNENFGESISKDKADEVFVKDWENAKNEVKRMVKVPLAANQLQALTSFSFALGSGKLQESTLLKRLNKGDYDVGDEFMKWTKARKEFDPEKSMSSPLVEHPAVKKRRELEKSYWEMKSPVEALLKNEKKATQTVAPPVIVPAQQQPQSSLFVPKMSGIDDPFLSLINSGIFG